MTESALRDLLLEALTLKRVSRAGWDRHGIADPESVAAHSWGVSWLVLVLCPSHLDRHKALALAILHDLPEVRCGDITPHDGIAAEEKEHLETVALSDLLGELPQKSELMALWQEYQHASSLEAHFVKACDKLDMALQAELYAADHPELSLQEFIDSALKKLSGNTLAGLVNPKI